MICNIEPYACISLSKLGVTFQPLSLKSIDQRRSNLNIHSLIIKHFNIIFNNINLVIFYIQWNPSIVAPMDKGQPLNKGPSYNHARLIFNEIKQTSSGHTSIVATKALQKGWPLLRVSLYNNMIFCYVPIKDGVKLI